MRKITILIVCMMSIITFAGILSVKTSLAEPTNQSPVFGTPSPANGSIGNWLGVPPTGSWIPWNIPINDPEGNRFSWTIQCSNGQTSSSITGAYNQTVYLALSTLSYLTTYKVWVNATDPKPAGSGLYTRRWYTLTTRASGNNPPVLLYAPSPDNGSSGNRLSLSWNIWINDLEGNLFSWTIQCSNGQANSNTGVSDGTKSLALSGLAYSTSYKVWVNATDPTPAGSGLYIRRWFTFTTKANDPPMFGTTSLPNGSTGNSLSFSWNIPINDPEGNSLNWRIECSNGQSANANGALSGTKSLSLSGLTSSKTYTVWVNATDPTGSGLYTRRWFTFTTQGSGGNNPPVFGTPSPGDGSSGNRLNLRWSIPINDPEGTIFSWTIQCSNGQTSNGTGAANGIKSLSLSGLAYSTSYKVWVNATDPTGSGVYTRKWYTLTTEPIVAIGDIPTQTTWAPITSESGETRVGPLVADINNDGRMEIIRSGINGIVVYDGLTGAVVWRNITAMWDSHNPLEIIDLNKDGYLDVISSYDTGTRALSGKDGSLLWYNPLAPLYNKHAVTGDINGDGYPEVFVCAAGAESGSPQGWITALRHDGTIFAKVHTYFPCYGGLSLGDTNHDGVYELYMGERNVGYGDNVVGKGLRALWASNLTEIWSHPEILCSSHCPTLVDTNKDGILDVVVLDQNGGIAVYNSSDGSVIHYSKFPGVRFHSQPTIYDIDGDGNLEIIAGGYSDHWGYPVIFDLYTWTVEAWLPFKCWEPPAIADLNGDGRVEILECTITNISIFDDNYVFRGPIQLDNNRSGDGWYGMSMIVAQDIDNDGLLELVLNRNTRLYAYETNGVAPTPRASSQFMYYSPLRGRYPYSTPYRSTAPQIINEYPPNAITNIPYNPQLSVYIYDNQQNSMNITFETNASTGVWHTLKTYSNVHEGTYTTATTGINTPQNYYWWRVTVTDSTGQTTVKVYTFKTLGSGTPKPPYTPSDPSPGNASTGNSVTADLGWTGGDPNGYPVTYDVYFGTTSSPPKVVSNQSSLLYNPSTMTYNTIYYWKIIAWDNHSTKTEGPLWEFTTGPKVNTPPNTPNNPSPANGATNVLLSTTLSWAGGDPDGDPVTYDVYFGTTSIPTKVMSNQSALSYNPRALAYDTTYYWYIIAWDNHSAYATSIIGDSGDSWNFTTQKQPNRPPNTPNKPSGIALGKINFVYTYSTNTTDPDGDQVYYQWNWSDGHISDWRGPYGSGVTAGATHNWTIKGSYSIKVKAKDSSGAESPWSDPLPITMPYSYNPIQQFLDWLFQRFPHAFPILRHLMGYSRMSILNS